MNSKINTPIAHIEIFADSLVKLHKVLKEEDRLRAYHQADKYGEEANLNPTIVLDFSMISSIQEDYKHNGTIIFDKKMPVAVVEPLADVLDAWIEVKENLSRKQKKN